MDMMSKIAPMIYHDFIDFIGELLSIHLTNFIDSLQTHI